jgi:diguanylate cyclase (GGDEF)-like protein/PAS domain S-box-containing protein
MTHPDPVCRHLLDQLYDGVYFLDRQRRITFWNKGAERITGFSAGEVVGRSCAESILQHVDDRGRLLCDGPCPAAACLADRSFHTADVFLHHKLGHRVPVSVRVSPLLDENGTVVGAVEVFSDTGSLLACQERIVMLEEQSLLDPLTGLTNRRGIERHIHSRLGEMKRYGNPFGLLFIDLDHFKQINDTHGHNVGDAVLRMVGRTLDRTRRPFDTVGRWGGEEFVALVVNVDRCTLEAIAERFRRMVGSAFVDSPQGTVRVTISLGGTLARAEDTIDTLMERADNLMYLSKSGGRDRLTMDA